MADTYPNLSFCRVTVRENTGPISQPPVRLPLECRKAVDDCKPNASIYDFEIEKRVLERQNIESPVTPEDTTSAAASVDGEVKGSTTGDEKNLFTEGFSKMKKWW
mmetsp:Transcript_12757/g.16732  ORF Transcript_12757/g.16732 Transcript_12757/m.16732 type:complete len:105 (+) Transcript_12757:62-376(+)